jgi:hypothetical protein
MKQRRRACLGEGPVHQDGVIDENCEETEGNGWAVERGCRDKDFDVVGICYMSGFIGSDVFHFGVEVKAGVGPGSNSRVGWESVYDCLLSGKD